MQMKPLLALVATIGVVTACNGKRDKGAETANVSDTIIPYAAATRDTIIKYSAAGSRDTIIMHAAASANECDKVPRPPECPVEFLGLRMDTIIRR
jgi:hypothetical protein